MTISKQSLQLSQDLMELQSRYNELNRENNRITSELRIEKEKNVLLQDNIIELKDKVKKKQATLNALSRDNGTARRQCNKGCFLN